MIVYKCSVPWFFPLKIPQSFHIKRDNIIYILLLLFILYYLYINIKIIIFLAVLTYLLNLLLWIFRLLPISCYYKYPQTTDLILHMCKYIYILNSNIEMLSALHWDCTHLHSHQQYECLFLHKLATVIYNIYSYIYIT